MYKKNNKKIRQKPAQNYSIITNKAEIGLAIAKANISHP